MKSKEVRREGPARFRTRSYAARACAEGRTRGGVAGGGSLARFTNGKNRRSDKMR